MEERKHSHESRLGDGARDCAQLRLDAKGRTSTVEQEGTAEAVRERRSVKSRLSTSDGTPLERAVRDTKRGRGSESAHYHGTSQKRKSPELSHPGLESRWYRSNDGEGPGGGAGEPSGEGGGAGNSRELEGQRSGKRIKLKSSIISCTDQGRRGHHEIARRLSERDKLTRSELGLEKPSRISGAGDLLKGQLSRGKVEYNVDAEKRRGAAGSHHPGVHSDRNEGGIRSLPQNRRGGGEQIRGGVQHAKNASGGESSSTPLRTRPESRQLMRMVKGSRTRNEQVFSSDDGHERVALKRGRDHEAGRKEDAKKRKDASNQANEDAETTGERLVKYRPRDSKALVGASDRGIAAGDKRSFRGRLDRSRDVQPQEKIQNAYARHSTQESDRNQNRHSGQVRDLRETLVMKNRRRRDQRREGKSLSKLQSAGRNVEVRQLSSGAVRPQSRKEALFTRHRGASVARIITQIRRGATHITNDGRWRDESGPSRRDVRRFSGGADKSPPRRAGRDVVNYRLNEWPKGAAAERMASSGRRSHHQNFSRDGADYTSKTFEEAEEHKVAEFSKGSGHQLASEISYTADFGGTVGRRCSSKIVAVSQQDSEDGASDHENRSVEVRGSPPVKGKESSDVQENGTMDNRKDADQEDDERVLDGEDDGAREDGGEDDKGSRQPAIEIHDREGSALGSDRRSHDQTNSPVIEKSQNSGKVKNKTWVKSKDSKETLTESTKVKGRARLPSAGVNKDTAQRGRKTEENRINHRRSDGFGQQKCPHHRDRDSRGKTDSVQGRAGDLREVKRSRDSREKNENSNEDLSRRRDSQSIRKPKRDDERRQRRLSRSPRSASPNWQKESQLPGRDHSKPSSTSRPEKDRKERGKHERDGTVNPSMLDSRYRRFGGGTSGLGGYSPRRRRSDAAIKTPSPPPRSPERRRPPTWDAIPPGIDNSMIATISAAHQAVVQHALVTLATAISPMGPASMMVSPAPTATPASTGLPTVPSVFQSLIPQVSPAVTAVTLTQATRPLRRLYIGNVPATVSDGELLEFINAAMLSANAHHLPGTKPCINCSVNAEKGHACAEFITPEDATAALAFDGVTLHGTTLKIRRPKDFALPPNLGIESALAVPDMVSSFVVDSPLKVFVGGIPSSVTADKVKELVTAFGQLKAYHWELDLEKHPPQAYAFLEYMDPAVMLSACAGLNGMRLGTGYLTVMQATPHAHPESADNSKPFYGVPEHAKSLLEPPSRVLELKDLVLADEVCNLSKEEIEGIIEDVRIECSRFGNVKSTHLLQVVAPSDNTDQSDTPMALGDASIMGVQGLRVDNTSNKRDSDHEPCHKATAAALEEGASVSQPAEPMDSTQSSIARGVLLPSANGVVPEVPFLSDMADAKSSGTNLPSEGLLEKHAKSSTKTRSSISEPNISELNDTKTSADEIAASDNAVDIPIGCGQEVPEITQPLQNCSGTSDLTDSSTLERTQGFVREWELTNVGKIYVEFSREEAACQAAHTLHGRTFAERRVSVCYFPLKLYQKKFIKENGAHTVDQRQTVALAVQGHLTAHLTD